VSCQIERSQLQNREMAMRMLKSRLYELEKEKLDAEKAKLQGDKKAIGWGNQIRSYVFMPYQMVKDHRTDIETGNIQSVMDGDIDDFIIGFLKEYRV
jgi:peptide chain release factor 2